MPAVIEKRGDEWIVRSHRGGRILGHHRTRKAALKQQRAVNRRLNR